MMSVKDIVGSLVIAISPHLGDIKPSGGGLSGRVFFLAGLSLAYFLKKILEF